MNNALLAAGTIHAATPAEMNTGSFLPITDICALFLQDLQGNRANLKSTTQEGYQTALKHFTEWIRAHAITYATAADITAYRDSLAADINSRTGKPLAKTTQARYIRAVGMLFKWASTRGLYPNIADGVKGPKIRQDVHHRDALGEDDCKRILDSIDRSTAVGKRDYAIFLVCLTCTLRTIELERLNIEDLRTVAGQAKLAVWGKGRDEKDALVPIEAPAEAAIKDYLQTRPGARPGDPLFMSTSNRAKGRGITRQSLSRIIKARLRAAGYDSPRITAHSLRHTGLTLNRRHGGTLEGTRALARHSSITTTQIYDHTDALEKDHPGLRIYNAIMGTDQQPRTPEAEFAALSPEERKACMMLFKQLQRAEAATAA